MNGILHSVDRGEFAFQGAEDAAHEGEKSGSTLRRQVPVPVWGAEDQMSRHEVKGLRPSVSLLRRAGHRLALGAKGNRFPEVVQGLQPC